MRIGDQSSNTVGWEVFPGAEGQTKFMLAEETGITPLNSGPEPEHARPIRDEQKAQMMIAPDVRAAGLQADAGTVSPEPGDTVTDDSGRTGQLLDVYEMAAYRSGNPFAPHADIRWEDGTVEQEVNLDAAHLTFARRAVGFTEGESVYLVDPDFPTDYMGQGKFYGYTPEGKAIIVRTDVPGNREEHWHPDAVQPYLDRLPGMGIWSGRRVAVTDQDGVELGEGDTVATTGGAGEILEIRGEYLVVSIGNNINTRVPAAETMLVKKYQKPSASASRTIEAVGYDRPTPGQVWETDGFGRVTIRDVDQDGVIYIEFTDPVSGKLTNSTITPADWREQAISRYAGYGQSQEPGAAVPSFMGSEDLGRARDDRNDVQQDGTHVNSYAGRYTDDDWDQAFAWWIQETGCPMGIHRAAQIAARAQAAFMPGDHVVIQAPGHRDNGKTATVAMTPDEALAQFRGGASWPTIPYAWSGGQYIATLDKAGGGTLSDRVALSKSEMRLAGRTDASKRTASSGDETLLAAMFTSKHVGRIRPRLSRRQEEVMGMISRAEGSLPLEIGQKYRNMIAMGMDPDAVATDLQANLAIYRRIPDA